MSSINRACKDLHEEHPAIVGTPLISLVILALNEKTVLLSSHHRVCGALDSLGGSCEIVYIDKGLSDADWHLLQERHGPKHRLVRIPLNAKSGKQAAVSAALRASRGQGVIILDTDLQSSPELIWGNSDCRIPSSARPRNTPVAQLIEGTIS